MGRGKTHPILLQICQTMSKQLGKNIKLQLNKFPNGLFFYKRLETNICSQHIWGLGETIIGLVFCSKLYWFWHTKGIPKLKISVYYKR